MLTAEQLDNAMIMYSSLQKTPYVVQTMENRFQIQG